MMSSNDNDIVICRSCIKECTQYKSIYHREIIMGTPTTLADLLSYCTNLIFKEGEDFMPSNICGACVENLYLFNAFKQTALKVDQRLRWEYQHLIDYNQQLGQQDSQAIEECDEQQANVSSVEYTEDSSCGDTPNEGLLSGIVNDYKQGILYEQERLELEQIEEEEDSTQETRLDYLQDSQYNPFETSAGSESEDNFQDIAPIVSETWQIESAVNFEATTDLRETRASLRTHLETHQVKNLFLCDICGKEIVQKSGYKKHMLTHTGEKPHNCDICGRDFRYSSNLIIHKRRHSGERPYSCSLCEKSFYTSEKLRRHKKVHDRDGIFNCEECGQKFRFRNTLKEHLRVNEKCLAAVGRLTV